VSIQKVVAEVRREHVQLLSHVIGTMQAGVPYLANGQELADLGNLAGALNAAEAAQYPPVPPPPSGAADPNWGLPPGITFGIAASDTPLHREDDQDRVRSIPVSDVYVLPLIVPDTPYSSSRTLSIGVAEFGSPPTVMQACLSKLPGDFAQALARSEGTSVLPLLSDVTKVTVPKETIYLNVRMYSSDLGRPTATLPHSVRVGGGWPR